MRRYELLYYTGVILYAVTILMLSQLVEATGNPYLLLSLLFNAIGSVLLLNGLLVMILNSLGLVGVRGDTEPIILSTTMATGAIALVVGIKLLSISIIGGAFSLVTGLVLALSSMFCAYDNRRGVIRR